MDLVIYAGDCLVSTHTSSSKTIGTWPRNRTFGILLGWNMAEEKLRGGAINLEELEQILQPEVINMVDVAAIGMAQPFDPSEIQQMLD